MGETTPSSRAIAATVAALPASAAERFGELVAARYKGDGEWRELTYAQVTEAIEEIALGLASLGIETGERIGILSDTHDQVERTARAVRRLTDEGAEALIHCGDMTGPDVVYQCAGLESFFVFGNNDWDRRELARYAESIGVQCLDEFGEITLDGKRFAITHGDDSARLKRIHNDQHHDYLITGHTHVKRDERVGKIRWINPGALHRAREKTVAILDPVSDILKFLSVDVR